MTEQYGIFKVQPISPQTDLFRVPHQGRVLTARYPAFGIDRYPENIKLMDQDYYHSHEVPKISFRPATTSESISIAAHNFAEIAKPQIFDRSLLQLGWLVKTSEGIFANPPIEDEQGDPITDENALKARLNCCRGGYGIYLGAKDFGFAPYETFITGVQESGDFAQSGLARLLEHSNGQTAPNLAEMSSRVYYEAGTVIFYGFNETKEPQSSIAVLGSGWGLGGKRLVVYEYDPRDNWAGYAFGVQKTE